MWSGRRALWECEGGRTNVRPMLGAAAPFLDDGPRGDFARVYLPLVGLPHTHPGVT